MRFLLASSLIVFLFLPCASLAQSGKSPVTQERLIHRGSKRTFFLYVPPGLTSPAPVLLTLYGKGREEKRPVERWVELARSEGMIVAGPVARDRKGWQAEDDGTAFMRQVIEAVKSKHQVDAQRIYLFGAHEGAAMSVALGLIDSQYYAATVGYAGTIDAFSFRLIDNAERKIPIGLVIGTADRTFSFETIRATRDALNARSFPFEIIELGEHDNDYNRGSAGVNLAAWNFLKQHQLP
jgi:poly(3-hydroxybutyrate) depolymerase